MIRMQVLGVGYCTAVKSTLTSWDNLLSLFVLFVTLHLPRPATAESMRLNKKNTQTLLKSCLYFNLDVWLGDFGPQKLSVAKYRFPKSRN